MKNNKLKFLIVVLVFFLQLFFVKYKDTFAIYRSNLSTTINLTVLDPNASYVVTLEVNDGTGTTTTVYKTYNQTMGSDLYTPTRTNYNFIGWYDENDNRIYDNTRITGNITFHAEWAKIVCKKVTDSNKLHTETCGTNGGCTKAGTGFSLNDTITYGTIVNLVPVAGDAYDCDVNDDGTYDPQDANNSSKYTERFYFVREKENNGSDDTAVLVYYTSYDNNGIVDSARIAASENNSNAISSVNYATALTYLPTSQVWDNPSLVDFDGNGKVSRFITVDDMEAVCGPIQSSVSYITTCQKWFWFENSRFQAKKFGRAGIWFEINNNQYYRLQTESLGVQIPDTGADSSNMARPVIEIPINALEGYQNEVKYTVSFNTHEGTEVTSIERYEGQIIDTLPTTTRNHYTFDGWYATYSDGVYSNPVTASTVVLGDMTLHAKWIAKQTCEVTLVLNGGTGLTTPVIVDIGETYDPGTPTKENSTFVGWFTDSTFDTQYNSNAAISTSTLTLYAKWTAANYVAIVEGVGSYETLADAIEHVPVGTSSKTRVTILKDITLDEMIKIPSNKWVELDGGSYTISGDLATVITNSGKLDVISGTITTPSRTAASTLISNGSRATLNILGGTLTNPSNNSTTEFLTISNVSGGTVNITGGTLNSYGQSASINNKSTSSILKISGGKIIAHNTSKGQSIYMEGGTVNISGNAYLENVSGTNARACVDSLGGEVYITGGTIVSKGYVAVATRASGNLTGGTITIGTDDNDINITTPVMRGKEYGLLRSAGTANVYDGIFESLKYTRAISGTIADQPDGTSFIDSTIDVDGTAYYSTYLSQPSYTVKFYPENGNSTITETIDNGDTIGNRMPNETKTGYLLEGWFDGDEEIKATTVVLRNINAYARWVKSISTATIDSTLSVEKNSSATITITGTDLESRSFTSSDPNVATVSLNGTVTGVTVGSTTITITGLTSGDTETVSVTVTPETHTITFYTDSTKQTVYGSPITVEDDKSIESTQNVSMPSDPSKTNYIFAGWVIEENNSLTTFTSDVKVYDDIDVMATWDETIAIATIPTSPLNIASGTSQLLNVTATGGGDVEDYTLSTSDSNIVDVNGKTIYGVAVGSATITITGRVSGSQKQITINVVSSYTVTFQDDNDTVLKTIMVAFGDSIDDTENASLPSNPTKTGYTFDDWYYYDGNDVTTTRLDTSLEVTSNIVYKPRWAGENDVAAIGTTYYTTYKAAIDAVPKTRVQTEVRLLKDVSTTGFANNRAKIESTQNVLLIGNNHTMTCSGADAIWNTGVITIKNVKVTCGISKVATINNAGTLTIIDSNVTMTLSGADGRAAVFNDGKGKVTIKGDSVLTTVAKERSTVQNYSSGGVIDIQGGTISQLATDSTKYAVEIVSGSSATISGGNITSKNNYAVGNTAGTLTVTGGTITSQNSTGIYNTGTLTIGTQNTTYDVTTPIIQGELYGINSTSNYSIYDGTIKGKTNNQAVKDSTKITGYETGYEQATGTDGNYYTLYYVASAPPANKYTISFDAINEDINPSSLEIDQGASIETLPTNLTWGAKTLAGWYTDTTYQTAVSNSTVPTGDTTYYAKWTYTPASQLVTFDSTSDAISTYFSNINTWKNLSESDFATAMNSNFTTNNCSACSAENSCNSRSSGTSCEIPKSYNTNANGAVSVYLYDNTNHIIGREAKYANGSSGTITNLIPGQVYYWEKDSDPTVNGLIEFTTPRRTLDVGDVRNVRDLGGLSATYTENNVQHTGTLKYGKLFRGAELTSNQDDVTNLTNLGITREIDLRADSDGSGQVRLPVLDNGSGGSDIVITNYLINPEAVTYSYTHNGTSYTTVREHASDGYPSALKSALKATMRYIVNGDSIYFHCTIGTDRTGTLAYFLEGLLGVSKEDRLEDYDLTYFYGLKNRTRYHDDLTSTSIYPRFKFMHTTYSSNQDIYDWYVNYNQESDDLTLLSQFRQAMIE